MSKEKKQKNTRKELEEAIRRELKKIGVEFSVEITREDLHQILNSLRGSGNTAEVAKFISNMKRFITNGYGDAQMLDQLRYIELKNCIEDIYWGLEFSVEHGKSGRRNPQRAVTSPSLPYTDTHPESR